MRNNKKYHTLIIEAMDLAMKQAHYLNTIESLKLDIQTDREGRFEYLNELNKVEQKYQVIHIKFEQTVRITSILFGQPIYEVIDRMHMEYRQRYNNDMPEYEQEVA